MKKYKPERDKEKMNERVKKKRFLDEEKNKAMETEDLVGWYVAMYAELGITGEEMSKTEWRKQVATIVARGQNEEAKGRLNVNKPESMEALMNKVNFDRLVGPRCDPFAGEGTFFDAAYGRGDTREKWHLSDVDPKLSPERKKKLREAGGTLSTADGLDARTTRGWDSKTNFVTSPDFESGQTDAAFVSLASRIGSNKGKMAAFLLRRQWVEGIRGKPVELREQVWKKLEAQKRVAIVDIEERLPNGGDRLRWYVVFSSKHQRDKLCVKKKANVVDKALVL